MSAGGTRLEDSSGALRGRGRRRPGALRERREQEGPAAPITTITLCKHKAFGTPDFYFTALMIAHSFQKAAAKKKKWSSLGGVVWAWVQLILVSGPLLGPVRGTLSASPLPGCAGLIWWLCYISKWRNINPVFSWTRAWVWHHISRSTIRTSVTYWGYK